MNARNDVFVSYSHADAAFLRRLQVHLTPLQRDGVISLWDDTRLLPGSQWQIEIKEALDRARVAILLVSADFLASEFITTNELPPLLAAAEKGGTLILQIIVRPCRFERTPQLARFQAVNSPKKPLIGLSKVKQEMVFVKLSSLVEQAFTFDNRQASNRADSPVKIESDQYSDGSASGEDSAALHEADSAKDVPLAAETALALGRLVQTELDAAVIGMLTPSEVRERLQVIIDAVFDLQRGIRFSKVVCTYTILDDFSFRVEETETLSAADQDISIYHKYYAGSVPCPLIESLQFQASVLGEQTHRLIWTTGKNEPLGKEFLVCPIPPLKVHEPANTLHFTSTWPGGAEPLRHPQGRDLFQVYITPNAVGSVDSVEVFIHFEAPGEYVVERVLETQVSGSDTSGRRECRLKAPYYAKFESVLGGTLYSFRIDRVA
jgi:hypothetical protein